MQYNEAGLKPAAAAAAKPGAKPEEKPAAEPAKPAGPAGLKKASVAVAQKEDKMEAYPTLKPPKQGEKPADEAKDGPKLAATPKPGAAAAPARTAGEKSLGTGEQT